jgi:hypothetical protein
MMLCAVVLAACPGGDGTDTVEDVARVPATVADVQRRVFSFPDAAAFGRPRFPMELTFGDFDRDGDGNPQTGLFALDAVQGIVTLPASCDLLITSSPLTIPVLQAGQTLHFEPCAVAPSDGSLRVENANTGTVSISDPPAVALRVSGQVEVTEIEGGCVILRGDNGETYFPHAGPGVSLDDVRVDGARLTLDLIPLPDAASFCPGRVATVIAVIDVVLPPDLPPVPVRVTGRVEHLTGGCVVFHGNDGVDYQLFPSAGGSLDDVLVDGARLTLNLMPRDDLGSSCPGQAAVVVGIIIGSLP